MEVDNMVNFLNLDVVDYCVKQEFLCDINRHVVPPKGPFPTERVSDDARGNDGGGYGGGVSGGGYYSG